MGDVVKNLVRHDDGGVAGGAAFFGFDDDQV